MNQRVVYEDGFSDIYYCGDWLDRLIGNYLPRHKEGEVIHDIVAFQIVPYGEGKLGVVAVVNTEDQSSRVPEWMTH